CFGSMSWGQVAWLWRLHAWLAAWFPVKLLLARADTASASSMQCVSPGRLLDTVGPFLTVACMQVADLARASIRGPWRIRCHGELCKSQQHFIVVAAPSGEVQPCLFMVSLQRDSCGGQTRAGDVELPAPDAYWQIGVGRGMVRDTEEVADVAQSKVASTDTESLLRLNLDLQRRGDECSCVKYSSGCRDR